MVSNYVAAQDWKARYDEVGLFENGLAYVMKENEYGYVDKNGKEVIPCIYNAIGSFNPQGLVWVNKGGHVSEQSSGIVDGFFGIYDSYGKVILPVKYKQLGYFENRRSSDGNPYCKFRSIVGLNYGNSRYNSELENRTLMKNKGLAWVAKGGGCFDVHEPVPFIAEPFSQIDCSVANSFAFCNNTENPVPTKLDGKLIYVNELTRGKNKWGIVDTKGNILLPEGKFDFCYNPSEGYVPVVKIDNGIYTINYYNSNSKNLLFQEFKRTIAIAPVVEGKTMILDASGCQFVDMKGTKVGEVYDAVVPSDDEDIYTVYKEAKFGVIDKGGNTVIPMEYKLISTAHEGMMSYVAEDSSGKSSYGYMNVKGETVVTPQYSAVYHFENGRAKVRKGDKYGCIDGNGKMVFPCRFANIFSAGSKSQTIFFLQESKDGPIYAYKEYTDSRLYQNSFDNVRNYDRDYEGVAFVNKKKQDGNGELYGCVSSGGEMLIPCLCNSYEEAMQMYFNRMRDGFFHWDEIDTKRYDRAQYAKIKRYGLSEQIPESFWDF
ncbi:MAG: WG repeat-containing protein [Prevotella sp.]|nr:WG repeat-containing protein [Prevotella sp.]